PLQAEQLLDALASATGTTPEFTGQPRGVRAGQLPGVKSTDRRARPTEGERFLTAFGKPDRLLTCECERSDDTTLTQAFQMVSGPLLNKMLGQSDNSLGRLLASGRGDDDFVEELYLASLCRRPTDRERSAAAWRVGKAADRGAALEDLVWALVNAKEFLLRR